MKNKSKILLRVCLFALVFLMLFSAMGAFFQPLWPTWNNYYTTHGIYKEPKNTIETLFLGPSTMANDVVTPELYENYGICSYNMATERQPMIASYYWLQEVYRMHSETLDTLVLDVSKLRNDSADAYYHKALDGMRLSKAKIQAAWDYNEGNINDTFTFLNPLATYHNRWSSLESRDFEKFSYDATNGTRGYYFVLDRYVNKVSVDEVEILNTTLDESAKAAKLNERSTLYFEKIVAFCEQKDIQLVLIKTPANNWTSSLHNAVKSLADKHGLTYLDFNFGSLFDQLGYMPPFDSTDGKHMNYYGATKFTQWIGNYLVEHCDVTDVRGDEKYQFMEEQLAKFKGLTLETVRFRESPTAAQYIEKAIEGNHTVMIMVRDDAAKSLTDEQRAYFASAGLTKLSKIGVYDSYLAVIENGTVIHEALQKADSESTTGISYKGTLPDNTPYYLSSAGYHHGATASCLIDHTEKAINNRGINIVVYSNDFGEVIDAFRFDTHKEDHVDRYHIEMNTASADDERFAQNRMFQKVLRYKERFAEVNKAAQ